MPHCYTCKDMFSNLSGLQIVFVLVAILISMGIHEAMHAYVAHWLGDTTAQEQGRLTLNPLRHIDILTTVLLPVVLIAIGLPPFFVAKPVPFNPARVKYDEFGSALIGAAGPLTNLVLACLGALLFRLVGIGTPNIYDFLIIFIEVNVAFFVFNMIPFPPLDGSRVLYAFAPEGLQKVMMQIESAGFMAILVFMLLIFQFIAPVVVNIESFFLKLLLG